MTITAPPDTHAVVAPKRRRPRAKPPGTLSFGHSWWALPAVVLVIVMHYVATGIGGSFAFTDWSGIGRFEWIGIANFEAIFKDPTKLLALWNTLFLAIGSVLVINVVGLAVAVSINRLIKTRDALRVLFFMPVVLSPLAVSYIWKFILDFNGPLNTVLRGMGLKEAAATWLGDPRFAVWAVLVVVCWQQIGLAMVIYLAGLASVPAEIEEAAAIDGAGLWRRFMHVVLPSIRPAVAIATTLGLVNGLRIFDQIMALTAGGPAGASETLATLVYKEAFARGNFGYGAALALLLTVVILIFAVIQQRASAGRAEA